MAPATKEFFSATTFAIAGASKDPNKIGNKVSNKGDADGHGDSMQALLSATRAAGGRRGEQSQGAVAGAGATSAQATRDLLERHLALVDQAKRTRLGAEFCDVVKWYKEHGLEAVPIHPKESTVEDLHTVASVFDLPEPDKTSLSIITPPQVSLPILKTSLLELGIKYIWLQPGAEDDALKEWVEDLPEEDLKSRVIFGGPCILVEGEDLAKAEGKL